LARGGAVGALPAPVSAEKWVEYDISAGGSYWSLDQGIYPDVWNSGKAVIQASIFVELDPWDNGTDFPGPFFYSDGVNFGGWNYGFDSWDLNVQSGDGTLSFDYHYGYGCGYYGCQDWHMTLNFAPGSFDSLPAKLPKLVGGTITINNSAHYFTEEASGTVLSVSSKLVQTPGVSFAYFSAVGVPEPASWTLMLGGFGLVGGAMRSRRKAALTFA